MKNTKNKKTTIQNKQINKLIPMPSFSWYYTGFIHSDGSLYFSIEKNSSFLLELIKNFLDLNFLIFLAVILIIFFFEFSVKFNNSFSLVLFDSNNNSNSHNKNQLPHNSNYTSPVVSYDKLEEQQSKIIIKENKNKSGIYRFFNKQTGDCYIGSSADLGRRFYQHFYFFAKYKGKSIFYSAIKKYGIENFSLEILEYVTKSQLLNKEQYYINLFEPYYNISKVAGTSLGIKYYLSKETKEKMSYTRKNNAAILALSNEALLAARKAALKSTSKPVEVLNIKTNEIKIFDSIRQAAKYIKAPNNTISKNLKKNFVYIFKNKYRITYLEK